MVAHRKKYEKSEKSRLEVVTAKRIDRVQHEFSLLLKTRDSSVVWQNACTMDV